MKNFLSVAFRNLIKHKLYSIINILGLSVGLAACLMILIFVRDELSYDTQWEKTDRIARIHLTLAPPGRDPFVMVMTPGTAKHALDQYFETEIIRSTRFLPVSPIISVGGKILEDDVIWTDPETADMFDLDVIDGDLSLSLQSTNTIALSDVMAQKLFGHTDVLGEVMTMTNSGVTRDYQVTALYRAPTRSTLQLPALVKIDESDFAVDSHFFENWFSVNHLTFVELAEGVSAETLNARIDNWARAVVPFEPTADLKDVTDIAQYSVMALKDLRLQSQGIGEMVPGGNGTTVLIFSAIAVLILAIACINFMNLATAKSTQRAREVALKKLYGAGRRKLMLQFLGESFLITGLALILSLVVVELILPAYSDFLGKPLSLDLGNISILAMIFTLVVFVGLFSGMYPAIVLSGYRPARVLRSNKSGEHAGSVQFRNVLVVAQFTISIGLIIATTIVYGQRIYATNFDPGFDRENIIVVENLARKGAREVKDVLRDQIAEQPGVIAASLLTNTPANGSESNTSIEIPGRPSDESILIGQQQMDSYFYDVFKVDVIAGRGLSKDVASDLMPDFGVYGEGDTVQVNALVNETALRIMGLPAREEALGKVFISGFGGARLEHTIVGVMPDTHYQSMRRVIRPEMYRMRPEFYTNIAVRFVGDPAPVLAAIEALWRETVNTVPFQYHFVDEAMAEEFTEEAATGTLLAFFAGLAVFVACLGLYGLASFTAERRTKEIGVRKVLGAKIIDIVRLLVWQFSKPVLLANLIAWPLAAWGMLTWLEAFPYRLDAWLLLPVSAAAGLLALLIAWITVGGNAAHVARSKPIEALRYE